MTVTMTHNDTLKWKSDGKNYCLHVQTDDCPPSPIEEDDIVKIACWGNHSNLGNVETKGVDQQEFWVQLCRDHLDPKFVVEKIRSGIFSLSVTDEHDGLITVKDTQSNDAFECVQPDAIIDVLADNWTVAQCQIMLAQADEIVSLPVWIYEHSGITISCGDRTYPYNDRWDSGLLGWAYMDRKTVEENWPDETTGEKNWQDKAFSVIRDTIHVYDQYLTGDVYYYTLYEAEDMPKDDTEPDWNEVESCGGFYGSDIVASGMAEAVAYGLMGAIKRNEHVQGVAKSRTVTIYEFGALYK